MIAAIYARKSTESEKNPSGQSDSVELQITNARTFAAARGWEVSEVFADDGLSGATYAMLKSRQQMVDAAVEGRFQVLVISEQSRLGRDMIEAAYLIKTVSESGVDIYSYLDSQRISVDDEVAQAMTMLRGFAGAAERSGASKRTRAKAVALAKAGNVTGGRCYGYDNVEAAGGKVRHINEGQAEVVVRIFRDYADGQGHKSIRDRLNAEGVKGPRGKWASTTIRDILANEVYRGTVTWGKFRVMVRKGKTVNVPVPETEWLRREAPEMRIVPEDVWLRAQARREARRQATPRGRGGRLMGRSSQADQTSQHILSGLMVCGVCGGTIRLQTEVRGGKGQERSERWYVCSTRKTRGPAACSNEVRLRQGPMEAAVLKAVRDALTPEEIGPWLEAVLTLHRERWGQRDALKARLERDLADVAKRIGNLVEAVSRGDAPEPLIAAMKTEQAKKAALETDLAALEAPGGPILPTREGGTAKAWILDEASYRKALSSRIEDVLVLLQGPSGKPAPGPARMVLRKVLAGTSVTCTPEAGGFRFKATLDRDRLVSGLMAPSHMGGSRRGTSTCRGRD